jgi:hypothetical protein
VLGGVHTLLWLPRALQMQHDRRKELEKQNHADKGENGDNNRT